MSRTARGIVEAGLLALAGLGVGAALLLRPWAGPPADRVVRLRARDMAFALESGGEANPDIRVRVGERVRIVLANSDRGMTHDLAVLDPTHPGPEGPRADGRSARTGDVRYGEEGSLVVRFREPGTRTYLCTYHPDLMRGSIHVVP